MKVLASVALLALAAGLATPAIAQQAHVFPQTLRERLVRLQERLFGYVKNYSHKIVPVRGGFQF